MGAKNAVTVTFLGDAASLRRAVGEVGGAADKVESRFGSVKKVAGIAGAAIAGGAIAALPGLFRLGNELESMGTKASTVFGESEGAVQKWAKANANAMGATRREAVGMAAGFADLLVPMGFSQAAAADMSTQVVGLSGALSAWSNGQRSSAEVSNILAKAMLGERDGLKELGISISEADVQARLLKNGTAGLTGAALEQAKAVATQQLIFEKSRDAQKAFADSTKTNTERSMEATARMSEFKDAIAVGLVPAVGAALAVGTSLLDWLTNLSPAGQAVVAVLGGLAAAAFVVVQATKAWTAVQAALNVVMSANPIGLVVLAIAGLVAGVVLAYNKVGWFRDGVQAAFQFIGSVVGAVVGAVVTAWDWLFGRLKGPVSTFVDVFRSVFSGIVDAAKFVFNSVARLWNNTVGKIGFEIPSWVPGVGGKKFSIPDIPLLAAGAVVTRPTLAMIGEGGAPEAVVPLDRAHEFGFGGREPVTVINVEFTGVTTREAADQVVKVLEDHFRRGGALAGPGGRTLRPA